jgi:asparagine synthase (glutamine-hydrolysing)
LFWARDGAVVLASTRLPLLVDALDAPPHLDTTRMAETLACDLTSRPSATSYEGIRRLIAGELLHIAADGSVRQRSALALPSLAVIRGSPADLATALREEVFAAVRRSIEGKDRVAVLAGGGVDSSALLATVCALARGGSPREVVALSLHFAGPADDRPYMTELAESLGIVPIQAAPKDFGRLVRRSLIVDGQPYASAMGGWELGLQELAKEMGADALLCGLGGDELFDGDPRWFALRALRGDVVGAARAACALRVPWDSSGFERLRDFVLRPIAVHATPPSIRRAVRRRRAAKKRIEWAGPILDEVTRREDPAPVSDFGARTPLEFFQRISDSKWALEMSEAQCSVDAEVGFPLLTPFHDEALVAFVARLPPESLFDNGYMRGLFRSAFAGLVPDRVRLRTDKGGFEPAVEEMHAAIGGRGALVEYAGVRALDALGVVRSAPYRAAFDAFVRGDIGHDGWYTIWPVLSMEAFAAKALGIS